MARPALRTRTLFPPEDGKPAYTREFPIHVDDSFWKNVLERIWEHEQSRESKPLNEFFNVLLNETGPARSSLRNFKINKKKKEKDIL